MIIFIDLTNIDTTALSSLEELQRKLALEGIEVINNQKHPKKRKKVFLILSFFDAVLGYSLQSQTQDGKLLTSLGWQTLWIKLKEGFIWLLEKPLMLSLQLEWPNYYFHVRYLNLLIYIYIYTQIKRISSLNFIFDLCSKICNWFKWECVTFLGILYTMVIGIHVRKVSIIRI